MRRRSALRERRRQERVARPEGIEDPTVSLEEGLEARACPTSALRAPAGAGRPAVLARPPRSRDRSAPSLPARNGQVIAVARARRASPGGRRLVNAEQDLEERLRHQLAQAARSASPPPDPPAGLLSSVRRRRRRRLLTTTASGATAVIAAVALVTVASKEPSDPVVASGPSMTQGLPAAPVDLRLELTALPKSPLDARTDASGVWTGEEFIVWGGAHGTKVDGEVLADGAAYHPGRRTWRRLAPAPLAARTRHSSAWTGEEMIVWAVRPDPRDRRAP